MNLIHFFFRYARRAVPLVLVEFRKMVFEGHKPQWCNVEVKLKIVVVVVLQFLGTDSRFASRLLAECLCFTEVCKGERSQ